MKKIFSFSVFALSALCIVLFSCNEKEMKPSSEESRIQLKYSFQGNDDEIVEALELLSDDEVLVVTLLDDKFMWNVMPRNSESEPFIPSKRPVCKGEGRSFVQCGKTYLNQKKCLKIYTLDGVCTSELTDC